jgi:hypothetical protein
MDILLYLTELLNSHKTIGIDGLGTLYKRKSPGKYDVEKHSFIPPNFLIEFTTEVKDPKWLALQISEKKNISVESASYDIATFVEKIHAQLAEHQEVDLPGLGKLQLVNDDINFLANKENNFGFEFYGLPTLPEVSETGKLQNRTESNLEEITKENVLEEENPGQNLNHNQDLVIAQSNEPLTNIEEAVIKEIKVEPITITPQSYTPNFDDEDDDYDKPMGKRAKTIIKTIVTFLVILVIIALAYFFNPQFFDDKIQSFFGDTTEPISTIKPEDSTIIKLDTTSLADTTTNKNDLVTLAKDTPAIDSSKIIIYEVIGSAEKSKKRIEQFIQNMSKKGIIAKPLKSMPGKLTKISLGSFTDYNLAKKHQDSLKKNLNNPEIYIQSIKPIK